VIYGKGARNFVFLSRSAGISDADQNFIKYLESYACRAIPIAGSVINASDVQRAIAAAATPIAGVTQMSMLVRVGWIQCAMLSSIVIRSLTD